MLDALPTADPRLSQRRYLGAATYRGGDFHRSILHP
jgi:hypothetical protein